MMSSILSPQVARQTDQEFQIKQRMFVEGLLCIRYSTECITDLTTYESLYQSILRVTLYDHQLTD